MLNVYEKCPDVYKIHTMCMKMWTCVEEKIKKGKKKERRKLKKETKEKMKIIAKL